MRRFSWLLAGLALACVPGSRSFATPTYLGQATIPGTATDFSGLTALLEDGTPANRLGGFGSGIAYTGVGNTYVAVPDRGPADGLTTFRDRIETFSIAVNPGSADPVVATLTGTTLLSNELGQAFTGSSAAFDATNSPASLRLDPESIRVAPDGTYFVSDEYGPFLYHFNKDGQRIGTIALPESFQITAPNANAAAEIANNTAQGRVTNRGMEGLAISPDGKTLYGLMQNPLAQDGGRNGLNTRIVQIDVATGQIHEFVYHLDNKSLGVNEIVAINDHQFLVIERDGAGGLGATFKKVFEIDTNGATDVSSLATLPKGDLPVGVQAVSKSLSFDLLNDFGLKGATFPEKIEGLAFGPDLANGDHLLLVTSDNDFIASQPSRIFAFSFSDSDLPGYRPQQFNAVPEPASVALLGVGLAALVGLGRVRARRARSAS